MDCAVGFAYAAMSRLPSGSGTRVDRREPAGRSAGRAVLPRFARAGSSASGGGGADGGRAPPNSQDLPCWTAAGAWAKVREQPAGQG